jgi:predicted amidohydrolase
MSPIRIAVWQGTSPASDPERAFESLAPALAAAGAGGATMLVAPEAFLPGYNSDRIAELAQSGSGDWLSRLSELCNRAGCGLTVGYAQRDGSKVFNAAVAFDAMGRQIAHYRKIQLYGDREKRIYAPGDAYTVFDLAGTKAAILICYDIEFAPHVEALVRQGVSLILVPTANMHPFTHVAAHTVPTMAANYGVSIAYANYCGIEGDLSYVGGSLVAGPHGEILAQAGDGPCLLMVDLPKVDPARVATQLHDFRKV